MGASATVLGKSAIGLVIAFLIGCSSVSNDLYEQSHDYNRRGRRALAERHYSVAQANFERALQTWPFGPSGSPDKAAVHNNLGWAFEAQRNHALAVANFEAGRTMFRTDTRCSHPFQAILLNNLCESEIRQHNWAYAREVCLEAFAGNARRPPEKVLPVVPPEDIAWGLFNYGVAWAQANGAESYFSPISKMLEPPEPEDGPVKIELDPATIADVYYQVGRLALQRGRLSLKGNDYQDSEQFHRRALDIRVADLGALHEITAESMAAAGHAELCRGDFSGAENDAGKALWVWQTLPEAWGGDLAKGHLGIGLVFEGQGRLPDALGAYWQGLYASVLDISDSTSESFRQMLRRCAGGTKPDSPEQTFMAMKKCRHLSETQNRLVAVSLHGIGRVLAALDPAGGTERFDVLALSVRQSVLGLNHPLVAQSHLAVGRAFEAQGKLEEARIHYRRASGIAESSLGPDHWGFGISLYNLARIMRLQGQVEDAERYCNRALAILQNGAPSESTHDEQSVRTLQRRIERDDAIDELQGPGVRSTIARDSPRLPRDHQTLDELFEKKKSDFLAMLQPGRKPSEVFKKFINMIDDPVDDLKHEVHGMVWFGRRIFWPEGFMQGSGDPCK